MKQNKNKTKINNKFECIHLYMHVEKESERKKKKTWINILNMSKNEHIIAEWFLFLNIVHNVKFLSISEKQKSFCFFSFFRLQNIYK